ncbi:MAG TPA: hypothetical protein VE690_09875 [Rhodopila sp.]|nr:hypothetical protein [Rhodopila sp.]
MKLVSASAVTSAGITACLLAGLVLVSPTPAQAQGSPFIGRWRLNKSLSTLPQGETAPADLVTDILRVEPLHVRWTVTMVDDQGQSDVQTFDIPANGEFYPINPDTVASIRLVGSGMQTTFRDANGQTDTLGCTVSGDQRRMTCTGAVTLQDRSIGRYVDVFDRVVE